MPKNIMTSQVHRFRDLVAIHIGGVTVYLTPAEAMALGKDLRDGARDVKAFPFTLSEFGTRHAAYPPEARESGRTYDHARKRNPK